MNTYTEERLSSKSFFLPLLLKILAIFILKFVSENNSLSINIFQCLIPFSNCHK